MEVDKDVEIFWGSMEAEVGHVPKHIKNILLLQGLVPNAALGTITREDLKEVEEDMRNRAGLLRKKLAHEVTMPDYYGLFGDSPEDFRFSLGEKRIVETIVKTVQTNGLPKLLRRETTGHSTLSATPSSDQVSEDVDCENLVKRLKYRFSEK